MQPPFFKKFFLVIKNLLNKKKKKRQVSTLWPVPEMCDHLGIDLTTDNDLFRV